MCSRYSLQGRNLLLEKAIEQFLWQIFRGSDSPKFCYPSLYVIMEETAINPTNEQAQACLRVCQMLSDGFRDIHLFRYNPRKGYVYILAGHNLEVMVMSSGEWRFIYESEI
ncbi:DUF6888 family protein [Laspinema olomoucense]|uniref:DUF6888 family protein n=1 Tax=Laspinema olomoucense TaxID=3231600 RepID=UPI0021BAD1AB|nr:hypothetical protein [Laspinema sp. D3d]MCT7971436.1 hypothetical protein [Laspinema sp. D3d]